MTLTLALLVVYALALVVAGVFVSRRVRGSADFFVAGRSLSGGLVFVTLLAANIGAGSTVGATGLGYSHGLSAWWWSGSAAFGCLALGLVVAPRLHRLAAERGFLTVGDFLEARYDRSVRGLVGITLWVGTLFILAGQLLAMAWAFEVIAGLPRVWGCVASGLVLVAYFSGGGLLASVWVNLIELVVLLVGFLLAVPFAWRAAGGISSMSAAGGAWFTSPVGMGVGPVIGIVAILAPSFVVSPGLIQKTYGARSAAAARWAAVANAVALALFAFVPAILGMSVRAIRSDLGHPELALPVLLTDVLPPWLGALGLAALFAAEISTADAVLFMLSTSLAKDLYQAFLDPAADDRRLLQVGRRTAVAAGILGVLVAVVVPSVVGALRAFYGVLTMVLFAPLLVGLLSLRPQASDARRAIVAALAVWGGGLFALRGSALGSWLPSVLGLAAAFSTVALAWLRPAHRTDGTA